MIAQDGVTKIDRSYIDNFSVKEFARDVLLAQYFPDTDINLRSAGLLGFTSEQISNITEDVFNTGSVYFRETFPNRAEIDESLYSHGAIFQITDIFSTPASCRFLMVLEESAIQENMEYDKDSGYYYFFIDKDTTTIVEDIPFILDYDIQIRVAKKRSETKVDYIYTATYIIDNVVNSISQNTDPYIKVRRDGGYVSLEVTMYQCTREVTYEQIINNSKINYPTIDIPFEGNLCGFDILYKAPTDGDFDTQMHTLPVYSQPITRPFCYYQLKDTQTLRLSFNSKDTYFMPDFNSELMIILYITMGKSGEFKIYNGTNIQVNSESERYQYNRKYVMSAMPLTASSGAMDRLEMNALQALTVEAYRTAMALTTEADLQEFFNNFKFRYGNATIMFTKLRDDIRERIFSAFIVVRHEDSIFKTNCLNLTTNLSEMTNPEINVYTLEPGVLFRYSDKSQTEIELFEADFLRDPEMNRWLWEEYQQAIKDGTIPYIPLTTDHQQIPEYLDRPASFAEFKKRQGIDDKLTIFDIDPKEMSKFDDPQEGNFLYVNPFLIRFKKNPNLISMYLPFINDRYGVDFTNQNEDAFVQFITYFFDIERKFQKEKVYEVNLSISSSVGVRSDKPIIDSYPINTTDPTKDDYKELRYKLNDPYNVENDDLRVILVIADEKRDICYIEMVPSEYNAFNSTFTFTAKFRTDDHLSSDSKIRLLDELHWREEDTGNYYKVTDDHTIYRRYDKDGKLLDDGVPVDLVTQLIKEGRLRRWENVHNMTGNDDILVPCENATFRIVTLYNRVYSEERGDLVEATSEQTNNTFVSYDDTYDKYIWTNEYVTKYEPVTLMKPLDYVRSDLEFLDYTMKDEEGNFVHDIMDVHMRSIPLIRWNLPLNEEAFTSFLEYYNYFYDWIVDIINTQLRNVTAIDVKFYNTYGRSKNYVIGDEEEVINTVNLKIRFDMWFLPGTDTLSVIPKVKYFIKYQIEYLNDACVNQIHMSNLMRKVESEFAQVDHIRFVNINNYPTTHQSVKVLVDDVNDLEKSQRIIYVPEMLTIDVDDIIINEYFID